MSRPQGDRPTRREHHDIPAHIPAEDRPLRAVVERQLGQPCIQEMGSIAIPIGRHGDFEMPLTGDRLVSPTFTCVNSARKAAHSTLSDWHVSLGPSRVPALPSSRHKDAAIGQQRRRVLLRACNMSAVKRHSPLFGSYNSAGAR